MKEQETKGSFGNLGIKMPLSKIVKRFVLSVNE